MADRQEEQSTESDYVQQHENITSVIRISSILRPLMDKHKIVSATLPNSTDFFNTALLKLDPDNDVLAIDELHPEKGHDLIQKAGRITLHMQYEGMDVNFTINLKNIGNENGIAYYELEFPKSIRYLQRRNSYRVPVSAANEILVELTTKDKKSYQGELHDISTGGMCIRFPKKLEFPLELEGEELECGITFFSRQKMKCAFKVCHTWVNTSSNNLHIGGFFIQLDRIQHRAIEKFVAELQRKARQKIAR